MFCKAAGIEYEDKVVNLPKREHKEGPYLAINKHGQVPSIVDGDLKLSEGAAILQYIAESRGSVSYYPADAKKKAEINAWLHWHHTHTRFSTMAIVRPAFGMVPPNPVGEDAFISSAKFLNDHFADSKFLSGDNLSIADFLIIPELDQLDATKFFDFSPYPNIQRYLKDFEDSIFT